MKVTITHRNSGIPQKDYKVIDFKNNENSKSNKICENSPLDFDFCREYRISFSKIFK
jgi:hypothetical protein